MRHEMEADMKRFVVLLGLMVWAAALFTGCELIQGDNKIQYPISYRFYEIPGNPITLEFYFDFIDETPDTSGVIYAWGTSNDTLWFSIKPTTGEEEQGGFHNLIVQNIDTLSLNDWTLAFEGKLGKREYYTLIVEDSFYSFPSEASFIMAGADEPVVSYYGPQSLYRLFPDMLLVETGLYTGEGALLDALKASLVDAGAVAVTLHGGDFSIFEVDSAGVPAGDRETSTTWSIYGNFDQTASVVYSFLGDTLVLDSIYNLYADTIPALSIRMGSGFDRYNWE